MPFVIFDDAFPDHPKVEALTDGAYRLHTTGIAWSVRLLTDGLIPEARVPRLMPGYKPKILTELVTAGLWHRPGHDCTSPLCGDVPDGHLLVHDFLDTQRSREQVLRDREAAASRQRRRRGVSHGVSHGVTPPVTNGVSHTTHSTPLHSEGCGVDVERTRAVPDFTPPPVPKMTDEQRAIEQAGIAEAKRHIRPHVA